MIYGMPYKGSKNAIAEKILGVLPAADCFVDLFGGGGAMAHAAAVSEKYKKVIYNELNPVIANGFEMAINGDFKNENRWISREEFFKLKDTDPYVAMCFSFGNDCKAYCYSREIEPWKRALHYARVFGDFSEFEKMEIETDGTKDDIKAHKDTYKTQYIKWYTKNILKSQREYELEKMELERKIKDENEKLRAYLIKARNAAGIRSVDVDRYLGTNGMTGHYFGRSQWEFPTREAYIKMQEIMPTLKDFDEVAELAILWQSLESLQSLQSLQSLESLQRLQRLERLESLQRLERLDMSIFNLSYEYVEIPKDAVMYCDIPYIGTSSYTTEFDHERFYDWAREHDCFISSYQMPDDFVVIASFEKTCLFGATNNTKTIEKIFKNQKFVRG